MSVSESDEDYGKEIQQGNSTPDSTGDAQPESISIAVQNFSSDDDLQEADRAVTFKGDENFQEQADDLMHRSRTSARFARDAFQSACAANNECDAEASFYEARRYLLSLWDSVAVRSELFQDLLGAIDVAIRFASFHDFNEDQTLALKQAFIDLAKYHADEADVSATIRRFVRCKIDLTTPVFPLEPAKFRVTIEELK